MESGRASLYSPLICGNGRGKRGGSSYLSHNDLRLHFGLGRRTEVDRILIRWPSGESQTVGPVPARRFVRIVEGEPWTPL